MKRISPLKSQQSVTLHPPPAVSKFSRWNDPLWSFTSPTPGRRGLLVSIRWAFRTNRETQAFTDPQWSSVLEAFRVVLWSMLFNPTTGYRIKVTSVDSFAVGMRCLVRWMAHSGRLSLAELDPEACHEFFESVLADAETRRPKQFTSTMLYRKLRFVEWIHLHGDALARCGLPRIPRPPFGATGAFRLAKENEAKSPAKHGAIPDTIAVGLMNDAISLIGDPAADIIALNEMVVDAYSAAAGEEQALPGRSRGALDAAERVARSFEFSITAGSDKRWHPPLPSVSANRAVKYMAGGDALAELRRLVGRIVDAAIIVIQSGTGMRPNEMCGLRSGIKESGNLPACVEVRSSASGLNDLFFIKGVVAKNQLAPASVEWIAGSRPKGSVALPPAVHAIQVLERILKPWRERANLDCLLVQSERFFLYGRGIRPMTVARLLSGLREFARYSPSLRLIKPIVGDYRVVVPYVTSGFTRLKSQQWRPTWCHFVFQTDPRLIPAISRQFKHLSVVTTEHSYFGNDPELLEALDETRIAETSRFFYEASTGKRVAVGAVAKLVESHVEALKKMSSGRSPEQAQARIRAWVHTHDLRIFFLSEGKCFIGISPTRSACHRAAGTEH